MRGISVLVLTVYLADYLGLVKGLKDCFKVADAPNIVKLKDLDCLEVIQKINNNIGISITEKVLGAGSFGVVLKCNKKSGNSKDKIAMKIVKYAHGKKYNQEQLNKLGESDVEDIERELKLFEALKYGSSLYIPNYYGCVHDESQKLVYVIQEQLDKPLEDFVDTKEIPKEYSAFIQFLRQKDFERTLGIMLQMAIGVKIIHENGYGHFDLKPDNFMVKEENNFIITKVVDFGLSLPLNEDPKNNSEGVRGTPLFMDPLWVKEKRSASPLNDVYSLGMTYMNILYGEKYADLDIENSNNTAFIKAAVKRNNEHNKLFDEIHDMYTKNVDKNTEENNLLLRLVNMLNDQIDMMLNEKTDQRLDEVIIGLDTILRIFNKESIYLPEKAKKLHLNVYGSTWKRSKDLIPKFLYKMLPKDVLESIPLQNKPKAMNQNNINKIII